MPTNPSPAALTEALNTLSTEPVDWHINYELTPEAVALDLWHLMHYDCLIDTPPPLAALGDIVRGLGLTAIYSGGNDRHPPYWALEGPFWTVFWNDRVWWNWGSYMEPEPEINYSHPWTRASLCAFLHQLLSAHHLTCASGEPSGASAAPGTDAKGAK